MMQKKEKKSMALAGFKLMNFCVKPNVIASYMIVTTVQGLNPGPSDCGTCMLQKSYSDLLL